MNMDRKIQWPLWILMGMAVCAFIVSYHCKEKTALAIPKSMGAEEYSVLPNEKALVWMSLGQEEFVADLIWIRALQYNNLRNEAHLAEHFAEGILALDPNFKAVYRWAAVAAVFSEGISPQSVERANAFLERGAKQFPIDPYYDYSIALNNISYYPNATPEKNAELKKEAIAHLQLAMQKPGADPQISMLISGLLNDSDDASAKIQFLQQAILTETNPETKKNLQLRLIMISEDAGTAGLMVSEKRDQWQREHHPYLPIMLDFMLSQDTMSLE